MDGVAVQARAGRRWLLAAVLAVVGATACGDGPDDTEIVAPSNTAAGAASEGGTSPTTDAVSTTTASGAPSTPGTTASTDPSTDVGAPVAADPMRSESIRNRTALGLPVDETSLVAAQQASEARMAAGDSRFFGFWATDEELAAFERWMDADQRLAPLHEFVEGHLDAFGLTKFERDLVDVEVVLRVAPAATDAVVADAIAMVPSDVRATVVPVARSLAEQWAFIDRLVIEEQALAEGTRTGFFGFLADAGLVPHSGGVLVDTGHVEVMLEVLPPAAELDALVADAVAAGLLSPAEVADLTFSEGSVGPA